MGTETLQYPLRRQLNRMLNVKLNNPLMGTETFTF